MESLDIISSLVTVNLSITGWEVVSFFFNVIAREEHHNKPKLGKVNSQMMKKSTSSRTGFE